MVRFVMPGELLSEEKKKFGNHVFSNQGKLYSDVVGFMEEENGVLRVNAATHERYLPKENDLVLGIITGEKATGYTVDIHSLLESYVQKKELREPLKEKNIISARVQSVSDNKEASLTEVRPFFGGELFELSPAKSTLAIGKNASTLELLKRQTNSTIMVGRNGFVWGKGGNLPLLEKAIAMIEDSALTDDVEKKLQALFGKNPAGPTLLANQQSEES